MEKVEGALLRRVAVALSVAALVACGFFLWLKLARGVTYVGPFPTFTFWALPGIAGSWLVAWSQRRRARSRVGLVALTIAFVLMVFLVVSALLE